MRELERMRTMVNIENGATIAHDQWSGWMKHLFSKCTLRDDGTAVIPKWAVDRWTRQMNTPYDQLPEEEKESDRKEARRYINWLMPGEGETK
jgi:hypothetical protein